MMVFMLMFTGIASSMENNNKWTQQEEASRATWLQEIKKQQDYGIKNKKYFWGCRLTPAEVAFINESQFDIKKPLFVEQKKQPFVVLCFDDNTYKALKETLKDPSVAFKRAEKPGPSAMEKWFFNNALYAKTIIAVGTAGAIQKENENKFKVGDWIIPTEAFEESLQSNNQPDRSLVEQFQTFAKEEKIPEGKTWTVSKMEKESEENIESALSKGCNFVDMEAETFFSLAKKYQVEALSLFCISDIRTPKNIIEDYRSGNKEKKNIYQLLNQILTSLTKKAYSFLKKNNDIYA
jgi:hypothetical protein